MKLLLFGSTGMVGMGALREALADPEVDAVLSISRRSCGVTHPKLREQILPDLINFTGIEAQLIGWDACLWALGISSLGLDEPSYAKVTEDLTIVWATALSRLNPRMSFCYVSAMGAGGKGMWARVRQRVEGKLRAIPFRHSGCVRPGFIRPGPGIRSQVRAYQAAITVLRPFFPALVRLLPQYFTTSEHLGRAMLRVVQGKSDRYILESVDINRLGAAMPAQANLHTPGA